MVKVASKIAQLKAEIARLETLEAEEEAEHIEHESLTLPEYRRYGRQMILDGFGLQGM